MERDGSALLHPAVSERLSASGMSFAVLPCDPALADTAAFCDRYGYAHAEAGNAIVVVGKGEPLKYVCCVILATCKLDVNKKVSALMGVKRCSFASAMETRELTGMEIGGVTPVGLPDDMPVYVDARIFAGERVVVGGGNRSSKLVLKPAELLKLANVTAVEGLGLLR